MARSKRRFKRASQAGAQRVETLEERIANLGTLATACRIVGHDPSDLLSLNGNVPRGTKWLDRDGDRVFALSMFLDGCSLSEIRTHFVAEARMSETEADELIRFIKEASSRL